jgi:hypothetical protein
MITFSDSEGTGLPGAAEPRKPTTAIAAFATGEFVS